MAGYVTGAMFFAIKTSIVWAPLIVAVAVWMPRYRWIAASVVGAGLLALYGGLEVFFAFRPDCESLQEPEVFRCREGSIARAILGVNLIGASLLSTLILLIGWLISRKLEIQRAGV